MATTVYGFYCYSHHDYFYSHFRDGESQKDRIRPKKFVPRFTEGEEEEGETLTLGDVRWRQSEAPEGAGT